MRTSVLSKFINIVTPSKFSSPSILKPQTLSRLLTTSTSFIKPRIVAQFLATSARINPTVTLPESISPFPTHIAGLLTEADYQGKVNYLGPSSTPRAILFNTIAVQNDRYTTEIAYIIGNQICYHIHTSPDLLTLSKVKQILLSLKRHHKYDLLKRPVPSFGGEELLSYVKTEEENLFGPHIGLYNTLYNGRPTKSLINALRRYPVLAYMLSYPQHVQHKSYALAVQQLLKDIANPKIELEDSIATFMQHLDYYMTPEIIRKRQGVECTSHAMYENSFFFVELKYLLDTNSELQPPHQKAFFEFARILPAYIGNRYEAVILEIVNDKLKKINPDPTWRCNILSNTYKNHSGQMIALAEAFPKLYTEKKLEHLQHFLQELTRYSLLPYLACKYDIKKWNAKTVDELCKIFSVTTLQLVSRYTDIFQLMQMMDLYYNQVHTNNIPFFHSWATSSVLLPSNIVMYCLNTFYSLPLDIITSIRKALPFIPIEKGQECSFAILKKPHTDPLLACFRRGEQGNLILIGTASLGNKEVLKEYEHAMLHIPAKIMSEFQPLETWIREPFNPLYEHTVTQSYSIHSSALQRKMLDAMTVRGKNDIPISPVEFGKKCCDFDLMEERLEKDRYKLQLLLPHPQMHQLSID